MNADKLRKLIRDNEYLELYDILERAKLNRIEQLLDRNIKYLAEREVGKKTVYRVKINDWVLREAEEEYSTTDTILGAYEVWFKDESSYDGNFVADGIVLRGRVFEITSLTIGSPELRYFG